MNSIIELAIKRKEQAKLSERIGENLLALSNMSDNDVRCYNISQQNYPLSMIVKDDVSFGDVYSFAVEYSSKNNQENILNEKIDDQHTLFWSAGSLETLIKNRKMNEPQYDCCVKVADMMLSGKFDDYHTVKRLNRKKKQKSGGNH